MIELIPSSRLTIDSANPVNWNHPSMQPGVRPNVWLLTVHGSTGGAKWRDLMSPADLKIGNHATLTRSTWRGGNRVGGFGHLSFNGTTDYATITQSPAINFAATQPFSFCLWMRWTSGSQAYVITKGTADSTEEMRFGVLSASGDMYWDWGGGSSYRQTVNGIAVVRKWQHVTCTFNGSTAGEIYVDGVIASYSGSGNAAHNAGTNDLLIGQWNGSFAGVDVDDLRIYPRLLSITEIRDIYQLSLAGYPGVLNRINTVIAPPTGSGLLLQRRRAAA